MAGQPPPHEMFEYHQAPGPSRSPHSARPNAFAAPGFASGMTLPRQNQRGYETLGSAALYGDHLNSAYRTVDAMTSNMGGVSPAHNMAYSFDANAGNAWAYNGNVATINGAMNGASRQRPMPRRTALPASWSDAPAMNMHTNQQNGFIPNGVNGNHMSGPGMLMDPGMGNNGNMNAPQQSDSDQLIPTAIVIKNIPFAVRKEQLAQIMVEMNLPQPYAFNYHFDNGVFRGLAFANFQNAEDTRAVIDRMNGLDVSGRKLRVEYKKMLPEAERERIEREKRERRGQLEEQHRAPILHQQPSLQSLNAGSNSASRTPNNSSTIPTLDLNDPKTLSFYTQLTIFKSDESRETLIFPATISPEDRRQIHIIAHHMGLEHQSWGETSDSRQLHIYRRNKMYTPTGSTTVNNVSVDAHRRGLSRAATFDLSTGDQMRSNPHNALHRPSPTIEYPVSNEGTGMPNNNLRAAKSFADLRSMTPSPSANSASGYLGNGLTAFATANASLSRLNEYGNASPSMTPSPTMHMPANNGLSSSGSVDPTMGLAAGLAGLGLSYDSMTTQHRSTPGAIGSQRPSTRPATDNSTRNAPDRQPRNPSDWNDQQAANFASRGRTNGHATRGSSDSSDNASRATNGTSSGRFH